MESGITIGLNKLLPESALLCSFDLNYVAKFEDHSKLALL